MGYFLFYIKYHVYTFITNIFKRKKREYLVFFVGKYPNNFKHGFKAILDYDSLFRFSIGSSSIITRFTTTKNIDEINEGCFFSSEKVFISNGKIYASEFFWKKDLPKLDKYSKIVDDPDFWKESPHFYFLKDERKNTNYQTNSPR